MTTRLLATFGAILAVLTIVACLFTLAHAEQPVCTGDRHYDGVACCPYVDETTTTTTLAPRVECPDPAPCPTVTCECGDGTTVNNVTVNRCPDVVFPRYQPCGVDHKGREHCAIRSRPHRVLKPIN